MEFGVALIVSGVAFILGALGASIWGEPASYLDLYLAGTGLIATGVLPCLVVVAGVRLPEPRQSIRSSGVTRSRLVFLGLMVAFVALILASSAIGTPHAKHVETLPSIALGSGLLFHVERAAVLLGLVGVVVLVGWRGAHGDWPIKLGNVEYAPKEAVAVTADALTKQDERLRRLEEGLPMAARKDALAEQDRRLRRLEERVRKTAEVTADALAKHEQRLRLLEQRGGDVDSSS